MAWKHSKDVIRRGLGQLAGFGLPEHLQGQASFEDVQIFSNSIPWPVEARDENVIEVGWVSYSRTVLRSKHKRNTGKEPEMPGLFRLLLHLPPSSLSRSFLDHSLQILPGESTLTNRSEISHNPFVLPQNNLNLKDSICDGRLSQIQKWPTLGLSATALVSRHPGKKRVATLFPAVTRTMATTTAARPVISASARMPASTASTGPPTSLDVPTATTTIRPVQTRRRGKTTLGLA